LTTAPLLDALTKQLQRAVLSFFKFVRPHGTIWPQTDGCFVKRRWTMRNQA